MYRCCNPRCKKIFDDPIAKAEDFGYDTEIGHKSAYQYFDTCPCCGNDFFDTVEQCEECGNWISIDDIYVLTKDNIEHYICGECADELNEEDQNELYWYI